jgi:hypothetical protein
MRHRAPRNLLALLRLLRLPRWRPRRRAAVPLPRRAGFRLTCAVASALALLAGGVVAASELGGESAPTTADAPVDATRTAAPQVSRSDGRTPWPTTTGTPTGAAPAPERAGAPDASARQVPAEPRTQPDRERSTSADGLLSSPLGVPTPHVSTSGVPSPDMTSVVPSPEPTPTASSPEPRDTHEPAEPSPTPPEDDNPPQTTILSGPTLADDTGLGEDSEFTFDADESATYTCSVDGGPFVPCTSPQEYDDLGAGRHEFAVRATDEAGNVDPTPDTQSWITTGLGKQTDASTDVLG